MTETKLMNMQEVCAYLDMKEVTIKRYVREGLLDSEQSGSELQFVPEKVEKFKVLQDRLKR